MNTIKNIDRLVQETKSYYNTYKKEISGLPVEEVIKYFRNKTKEFKQSIKLIIENDRSKDSFEMKEQKAIREIMTRAYGLVKLASEYIINESPYDVQIIGAIALNDGYISEMATGEGKTLTATMPAYLNALLGHGVHIITPNNYLAARDQKKMSKIYSLLGLRCGLVEEGPINIGTIESKKRAYASDITYGSAAAFAFDYLFDTLETNKDRLVLRDERPCFAIIDEADEVLFDDARVPFTISGNQVDEKFAIDDRTKKEEYKSLKEAVKATRLFEGKVKKLRHKDYEYVLNVNNRDEFEELDKTVALIVNQNTNEHTITTLGYALLFCHYKFDEIAEVLKAQGLTRLSMEEVAESIVTGKNKVLEKMFDDYSGKALMTEYAAISKGIMAWYILERDKDYTMKKNNNGEFIISPVVNGRTVDKRKYSDGLQQAIEIKEKMKNPKLRIAPTKINDTLASIPTSTFFSRYYKLAGMTGTSIVNPLKDMYNLETYAVPPNMMRKVIDRGDIFFDSPKSKYEAIFKEVLASHRRGQPVLITTTSIAKSVSLENYLTERLRQVGINIKIPVLNANVQELAKESAIIAKAGEPGAITISTEMAGRGTDIKLGGEFPTLEESRETVISYYIKEREKELGRVLTESERLSLSRTLNNDPQLDKLVIATNNAQKKKVLEKKNQVVNAGGLKIIGSGHFKYERIDRQVKGRCGRQGDVGEVIFFSDPVDLAEIGVPKRNVAALGRVATDNPYEEKHESRISLTGITRKAQHQAEGRQYAGIKAEQDFENDIINYRNEVYNEAQNVKRNNDYMKYMERYIKEITRRIIKLSSSKKENLSEKSTPERANIDPYTLCEMTRRTLGVLIEEEDIYLCKDVEQIEKIISNAAIKRLKDMNAKKYRPATDGEIKKQIDQTLNRVWNSFQELVEKIKDQYMASAIIGVDPKNNITNYIGLAFDYCFECEVVNLLSSILNVHYGEKGKFLTELRTIEMSPTEINTTPIVIEKPELKGKVR